MNLSEMRQRYPDRVLQIAVKGMLPKNKLGRQMLSKLHVYAGADHPHAAQAPQPMTVGKVDA
jgi:large subunit ribosomal protein L13